MLVLTRKDGERIVITDQETGEEIVLWVARIGCDNVRLGVEASRRFRILREELREPVGTCDNETGE